MSSLVAVLVWYGLGAASAAWLIRRGHSATLWTLAAGLVGALVVIPLVVSLCVRPAARLEEISAKAGDPDAPLGHRLAVWLDPDEEGPALSRGLARVPIRAEEVCLVRRVGFEANASWIDTGERVAATEQVRWIHAASRAAHRRFLAAGPRARVSEELSAEAGPVSFHVLGGAHRRHLAADAAPLLRATDVPVIVLPDVAVPAPQTVRPRIHREFTT